MLVNFLSQVDENILVNWNLLDLKSNITKKSRSG